MRIACLGAGTWGFSLASLLAEKGHQVTLWAQSENFIAYLSQHKNHPKLPPQKPLPNLRFTHHLAEAVDGAEAIVESVTSAGLRPVLSKVLAITNPKVPLIITSKGIEQDSCLLLPEVALELCGNHFRDKIGALSGPSHAEEVSLKIPTSIVASSYSEETMLFIQDLFSTPTFRVYPNRDLHGVSFGGALKNIIAIACGISDGLGFGDNTKAALMTRGLHEIRKLSVIKKADPETLTGLAGLGDLCVTCLSKHSRNYTFGRFIAEGLSLTAAKEKIGMVVEGVYTCLSAIQLSRFAKIPLPIGEAVYSILYDNLLPRDAVRTLLERETKEERL